MKYSENLSNKLNDLLNMNYEDEKTYIEAFKNVSNKELKIFLKERQIKRSEFNIELRNEIIKHNITPRSVNVLNRYYNNVQNKNEDDNLLYDEDSLLIVVSRLIKTSIDKYNELLRENSVPLSLCKILVKQADDIQNTFRVLERNYVLTD